MTLIVSNPSPLPCEAHGSPGAAVLPPLGLALVIALYSFPYIFIFTTAALELVSSEMEDAANILGAGPWRTMWRVTLPLALPAIVAIVIFFV